MIMHFLFFSKMITMTDLHLGNGNDYKPDTGCYKDDSK